MPSGLTQVIPSICHDLLRILDALRLDSTLSDKYQLRLKIAKRGLIIFCTLICRHRKHTDKCVVSICILLVFFFFSSLGQFFSNQNVLVSCFIADSQPPPSFPHWLIAVADWKCVTANS